MKLEFPDVLLIQLLNRTVAVVKKKPGVERVSRNPRVKDYQLLFSCFKHETTLTIGN
jgi:hypothetical protein